MSKGKEVIEMGVEGKDDENDDHSDGGRKRKPKSPNQDSPKRLKIQQDLNFSPNQEEEAPNPNPNPDPDPDPDLLFEKELTERDITQWRMSISGRANKRRVLKALREDERKKAREKDGLSVATTDADGVEYKLILEIQRSGYIILSHEWHMLLHKYKLKPGDSVRGFGTRDAAAGHLRLRLEFITK